MIYEIEDTSKVKELYDGKFIPALNGIYTNCSCFIE